MSEQVKLKGELSRNRLAIEGTQLVHVLLQVEAAADQGERLPLNVAAVIDRSGSMHGQRLAAAKQAAKFLVGQLSADDCLGVVAFDHEVQTVFGSGPVAFKEPLRDAIAGLSPRGATNLSSGLVQGGREARKQLDPDRVNRVIVLTDGHANQGVVDPERLAAMAGQLREEGIFVTTMGVGLGFDEDLLAAMATAGGGHFYFIENADAIPGIFAKELDGLLAVAAQGLTLTVRTPVWAQITDVYGYPCQATAHEAVIHVSDLYAGELKSIVLTLEVGAQSAGVHELIQAELTYHEARGGHGDVRAGHGDVQLGLGLSVTFAAPADVADVIENGIVMKEVHQAEAARALERAIEEADQGNFAGSQAQMQAVFSTLSNYEDDEEVAAQLDAMRGMALRLRADAYDASARKSARQLSRDAYVGRRRRQQHRHPGPRGTKAPAGAPGSA